MKNRVCISLASVFLLAACGGGGSGGGAVSTPPPAPAPTPTPTPVNTSITDLTVSQSFANDAAGMKLALDLVTKTGISGEIRPKALSISYDAAANSYTVSADGRSETFAPADRHASGGGETQYRKPGSSGTAYLTTMTTPYSGSTSNRYVGLAYWQNNVVSGSNQTMDFYIAAYGLPTEASRVPRIGSAGYRTDVFGAVSAPGQEPRTFQGAGDFSVDLAAGVFSTHAYLEETTLVTGNAVTGGGIEFTGAGHLSASDGGFTGNALYSGWFGRAAGPLDGRFYGPNAEELGGAFSGTSDTGVTVAGAFTGKRDGSVQVENLTLTNLTRQQLFFVRYPYNSVGQLTWQNAETFTFGPPTSDLYGGQFTIADKVAGSDPNFTEYRKSFSSSYDTQDVTLKLFRPGPTNTALVLTYSSFAHYSTTVPQGLGRAQVDIYGAYGLATPNGLLAGRTGTASYRGIVYGSGRHEAASLSYDVRGTSQFSVDFGSQAYTGLLAMTGQQTGGGATIDFGSYDVAGALTYTGANGTISRGGPWQADFAPVFFGPTGEEIVAPFGFVVPDGAPGARIHINGVAAAKRQ